MNKITPYIVLWVIVLTASTTGCTYLLLHKAYFFSFICVLTGIWAIYHLIGLHLQMDTEIKNFAESVHYKDFTRYFNVQQSPAAVKVLRLQFNIINDVYKQISKEKELHVQYLEKILTLINAGILSYCIETEEVAWMNEALKKTLQIPYMKHLMALQKRDKTLYHSIVAIQPGESSLTEVTRNSTKLKILISAAHFKTQDGMHKLLVFQNVNNVIEATESKAWNSLLNVMTHEIMNSVAPISSLSNTLLLHIQHPEIQQSTYGKDILTSVETIKRRSDGLLRFTKIYQNLNTIQHLTTELIIVKNLLHQIDVLMRPTLLAKHIQFTFSYQPEDVTVMGDAALLEQVIINLITNAIEALKNIDNAKLHIQAGMADVPYIKVIDNGKGIEEGIIDKIFIPFFTTKKNGNGIGLSICKQIMLLHNGDIQVHSIPHKGTIFTLLFNATTC